MRTRIWSLVATIRRHPVAVDLLLATTLAAGALVSLYTTFELLRQDPSFHEPHKTGIVLSLLLVTLPLALRRRFPLAIPSFVVAAFVIGRLALHPDLPGLSWEQYLTVWACWLALYTAVALGPATRRRPLVVAVLVAALLAETGRELFYKGGPFKGLPLNQGFYLAYNVGFIALPLLLGAAVRSL